MAFLTDYLLPGVYAYGTCAGFCLLFNIRGKKLFSAPMGGVVAWEVYLLTGWTGNEILQFFLAAMAQQLYSGEDAGRTGTHNDQIVFFHSF